jgi:hypothetical protein
MNNNISEEQEELENKNFLKNEIQHTYCKLSKRIYLRAILKHKKKD